MSKSYPGTSKDPEIISWEILLNDNDYDDNIGISPTNQNALIIELKNLQKIYPKDYKTNYGNHLNLAAG